MRRSEVNSILKVGAQEVTLVESRGKGDSRRPTVKGAWGTARYVADYNRIDIITTVVEDSKVDFVVFSIMDVAYRGNDGDDMIFVSTIDEACKIGINEKINPQS